MATTWPGSRVSVIPFKLCVRAPRSWVGSMVVTGPAAPASAPLVLEPRLALGPRPVIVEGRHGDQGVQTRRNEEAGPERRAAHSTQSAGQLRLRAGRDLRGRRGAGRQRGALAARGQGRRQ